MMRSKDLSKAFLIAVAAAALSGCGDEHSPSGAATATSAASAPAVSAPAPSASAPAPSAAPTATASAAPRSDCPKGSAGPGTLQAPCEAKGKDRIMEVEWTGKMDDAGPSFRVVNKSTLPILYGKIVVYFYDKAGKPLEAKDSAGKPHPNQPCVGNLFSGIMKPGEKAVITFSCVKKDNVPEGVKFIEGEMQTVGFADASEKKSEFYWRNNDLVPETRPKGGIK